MSEFELPALCWIIVAIDLLGLISAWLTRLSFGSRCQSVCQGLLLVCLGLVGGATVLSFALEPGQWLASGLTLALMAVVAVCDFPQVGSMATSGGSGPAG